MERKSDTVRRLVASGDFKSALRIAKEFRIGISKEDSDSMRRGYDCIVHSRFYEQLGIDPVKTAQKGVDTVKRLYGNQLPVAK